MAAFIIMMSLDVVSALDDDISDLERLISSYEDIRLDSYDLAFILAAHNFDAMPMGDFVEVNVGGKLVRCIPNGEQPGLCRIEF